VRSTDWCSPVVNDRTQHTLCILYNDRMGNIGTVAWVPLESADILVHCVPVNTQTQNRSKLLDFNKLVFYAVNLF